MLWEIIELEAEVVDSESIHSGNVLVQLIHPGRNSIGRGSPPYHRQCNELWERRSAGISRVL